MDKRQELTYLIDRIENWSKALGLDVNSTPTAQSLKFYEEFGELAKAIAKKDLLETMDGLGDSIVVATVIGSMLRKHLTSAKYDEMPLLGIGKEYDDKCPKPHESRVPEHFYTMAQESMRYLNYAVDSDRQGETGHYVFMFYGKLLTSADMLAKALDLELTECLKMAYTTIHFRSGEIVNGIFVKREPQAKIKVPVSFLTDSTDDLLDNIGRFANSIDVKFFRVEYDKDLTQFGVEYA